MNSEIPLVANSPHNTLEGIKEAFRKTFNILHKKLFLIVEFEFCQNFFCQFGSFVVSVLQLTPVPAEIIIHEGRNHQVKKMIEAYENGKLIGTKRLKIKESDRSASMLSELSKFGVDIIVNDDEIIIPDATRQMGGWMTIDLHCAQDPDYTAKLKIKLRKYEMTLEDNFETYNTDLWTPRHDGAKVDMAFTKVKDNYVRDGKLCLDLFKILLIQHHKIDIFFEE